MIIQPKLMDRLWNFYNISVRDSDIITHKACRTKKNFGFTKNGWIQSICNNEVMTLGAASKSEYSDVWSNYKYIWWKMI